MRFCAFNFFLLLHLEVLFFEQRVIVNILFDNAKKRSLVFLFVEIQIK